MATVTRKHRHITVNAGSNWTAEIAVRNEMRKHGNVGGKIVGSYERSEMLPDDQVAIVVTSDPAKTTWIVEIER